MYIFSGSSEGLKIGGGINYSKPFEGEGFATFLAKSGGQRSVPRSDAPVFCIAHHVLKKEAFYLNAIFQNKPILWLRFIAYVQSNFLLLLFKKM